MSNSAAVHGQDRVHRHRLADRLFHWLMAACMLTLLLTGFLPILGIKFAWVDPHWIAGMILTLLVLFHIIRALFILDFSRIWIRWREFANSVHVTTMEALGGPASESESANTRSVRRPFIMLSLSSSWPLS